jgi:hypothetical protein
MQRAASWRGTGSRSARRSSRSCSWGVLVRASTILFLAGCGDRTGIIEFATSDAASRDVTDDALATDAASLDVVSERCGPALCGENTEGTWRLETPDHETVGFLVNYPEHPFCGAQGGDQFILFAGQCIREGTWTIRENTEVSFRASAPSLGGNLGGCGVEPNDESLELDLMRVGCEPATYDVTIHDSALGSPFDLTATATRCRCEIGWNPCRVPFPFRLDPCSP